MKMAICSETFFQENDAEKPPGYPLNPASTLMQG